ncbi:unnamed protein product [Musa textilis]
MDNSNDKKKKDDANSNKNIKCYRCGKLGHNKKKYHVKFKGDNITNKEGYSNATNEDWGNYFIVDTTETMTSINFEYHYIIDSGCGHNLSMMVSNLSIFINMKKNLFSIVNIVDARNYILFYPNEVKFLRNIKELNIDVIYTGKRV